MTVGDHTKEQLLDIYARTETIRSRVLTWHTR
jgi:hypothetical protein